LVCREQDSIMADRVRKYRGFSLLEMVVSVAILMILMAISAPYLMNAVYAMRLRYTAVDLSGLMQKARIDAVRKNTFYSIQQATVGGGQIIYFVDESPARSGTISPAYPQVAISNQITVHFGTGSGAPGETAFVTNLGFTPDASSVLPNFNARGLPCLTAGATCPQIPGGGFVYFISNTGMYGSTNWAALAVTSSGRVQVWGYDGTNWNE